MFPTIRRGLRLCLEAMAGFSLFAVLAIAGVLVVLVMLFVKVWEFVFEELAGLS